MTSTEHKERMLAHLESNANYGGGAAFPVQLPGGKVDLGMTMRDYFAAKAMMGLVDCYRDATTEYQLKVAGDICKAAYVISDLMLEARKK